jgi:hypothetical protein
MKDPLLRAGALLAVVLPILANATAQTPASILDRLPKDATNLLVVRDPLPYVDAVLGSPELRAAATATAELQAELVGFELDPARLAKMLQPFRDFVPAEVVLATTPKASREIVRGLAAAIHTGLLTQAGRGLDAKSRASLTAAITAALQDLQVPVVSGWIRFRTERMASRLFDQVGELLEGAAGIERSGEGDRLVVTIHPALVADGQLASLLRAAGVDPAPLAALAPRLVLEQRGALLAVELATPAPGPLPAAQLGPLWREDPAQVVFFHTDCDDALDDLPAISELIAGIEWPRSASGAATALQALIDKLDTVLPHQATSVCLDNGIVLTTEADLGEEVDEELLEDLGLVQPPELLRRCIDPDEGPFALAGLTLDFALATAIEAAINRVAQRATTREVEQGLELMRRRSAELREYLQSEDSAVFQPGLAVVTRAASPPAAGTAAGALPFGAIAMVALTEDAAAGKRFVERMCELIARAAGGSADGVLQDKDLGLGAPTKVFALPPVPLPRGVAWPSQFQPHWLQRGELMVLSTDVGLSRALLARIDAPQTPGAAAPAPRAILWQSYRGDHVAAVLTGVAAWTDALWPDAKGGSAALRALAALAAQVESFDAHEVLEDARYRSIEAMRLRPRAPK